MKKATLDALLRMKADDRAAVLITRLSDGAQALISDRPDQEAASGELTLTEALADRAAAAMRADRCSTAEIDGERYFLHVHSPALTLALVGAVHIAQALVPIARIAGYGVTVIDPRRSFASAERFPDVALSNDWPDEALDGMRLTRRTAIVTLTHDPKLDDPALDRALRSEAFYIAALGSRRTHALRRERLQALGHDDSAIDRIHGPAGLPIGAVSPAEIAISVMAEMTDVLRGGTARPSATAAGAAG
ncbi:XdhC family protein [Fodinicurvata sp. EGI_FJ10296]|uniref:XdhC family protein n=1 Tax=Fodinicurvata sp. EGI_FJ10296 TaxID=3231908 RepID=UPI003453AEF5